MVGPDGIPVEIWRSLLDRAVDLKMPEEWKRNALAPVVKNSCAKL